MPFNNEHAARIRDPKKYDEFSRTNNKLGEGIHVIWGIVTEPERKAEIQAIRFDSKKFSPAQAKKWLKDHNYKPISFEPAKNTEKFDKEFKFIHKDAKRQLVYGIVLVPDVADSDGDIATIEEVEKAAHNYMLGGQVVGYNHAAEIDAAPVESYIAPVDMKLGSEDIPKGSWVLVTKVFNKKLWEQVESGEMGSYSIGAWARRTKLPDMEE